MLKQQNGQKPHIIVGQTGCRENWNLLSSSDTVHRIDGRYSRLNHLLGVDTRPRVDGLALDIEKVFSKDVGSFVSWPARTVEHTPCVKRKQFRLTITNWLPVERTHTRVSYRGEGTLGFPTSRPKFPTNIFIGLCYNITSPLAARVIGSHPCDHMLNFSTKHCTCTYQACLQTLGF